MTEKKNGVSDRAAHAEPAPGFDRWLNRQLHRLYDPVLAEPVPDEIMRLLHRFDDPAASPKAPVVRPSKRSKNEGT
jgi:hypothetical protein